MKNKETKEVIIRKYIDFLNESNFRENILSLGIRYSEVYKKYYYKEDNISEIAEATNENLEQLLLNICKFFGENIKIVKSKSRKTEYVVIRSVYSAEARRIYPKTSYAKIGKIIGKDRTSIMHGEKSVMKSDYFKMSEYKRYKDAEVTPKVE